VLVATVLGPEQGEDRELEVVRLASQQADDPVEFPVGKAECSVQRLFCDLAQTRIVSAAPAVTRRTARVGRMAGGVA